MSGRNYTPLLSGEQVNALLGSWYNIVGAGQQSGVPGPLQHGPYGGHHGHHRHAQAHGGMPGYIDGLPPRNVLVDAAGPTRAGREVLPMSVDGPIGINQSAQITARPQRVAFRPERVFISAASDAMGAAAWLVNDIKIGNRSQFSQSGSIPGDMFATTAIDSFISFETAQTAMDVVMVVTYIGANSAGVPFYGAIIGTAAI